MSQRATDSPRHAPAIPATPTFKNDAQHFFRTYTKKMPDDLDDDRVRWLKDGLGRLLVKPRTAFPGGVARTKPQLLQSHAIVRVLRGPDDPTTLYYCAAGVCSVEDIKSLAFIHGDTRSLKRLQGLFRDALHYPNRPQSGRTQDEEIRNEDKNIIVFGTACLHLCFSVGSLEQLLGLSNARRSNSHPQLRKNPRIRGCKINHSHLKPALARLWRVQDDRLGPQPPVFTSTSLAAGLMLGRLDPESLLFYEESRSLLYRLDLMHSAGSNSWNQLALLALVCNTRGGRTLGGGMDEGFREIQKAYITQEPTRELTDAVFKAIRGHIQERTRLPSDVFKLAWRLLVNGGADREAETYHALGQHVPFLGILESKVRDDEMSPSYREYFRGLRAECFEVVLDSVRHIPSDKQGQNSALWLFRTQFVFRAVEHYASCIMNLKDAQHVENDEALTFIRRVRTCLPLNRSMGAIRTTNSQDVQARLEARYKYDANIFERTCERFDQFVRGGQMKQRFAPEDRWCFSRDER
ncbi:hypothetical protein FRC04_007359 [Tulasnella sp. 424]|nr:hypothetical protein FRC04_007359 [Tulasnella sp. 424]KAG8971591.1 hypothetical protein FRC05_010937 [Tulasnella sp. 425]